MDPLDGPIAGLVEGDTFFQTPLLGCGAVDPPEKRDATPDHHDTGKYIHARCGHGEPDPMAVMAGSAMVAMAVPWL